MAVLPDYALPLEVKLARGVVRSARSSLNSARMHRHRAARLDEFVVRHFFRLPCARQSATHEPKVTTAVAPQMTNRTSGRAP